MALNCQCLYEVLHIKALSLNVDLLEFIDGVINCTGNSFNDGCEYLQTLTGPRSKAKSA